MTVDEAIEMLKQEYDRAIKLEYVHNPIAYALYHTWRKIDGGRK